MMTDWIEMTEPSQLDQLVERSGTRPQVIFKHSTRCSVSSTAKHRLENAQGGEGVDFYYLDILAHRSLSNLTAERFGVPHASPQVLVIRGGKCVFEESHLGIRMEEILARAAA